MNEPLSRRERQIMDILHRLGQGTAADIETELPDAPSYSAVRSHLRTLEDKGHVRHETEQLRYVFFPTVNPERARKSAIRHLVDTFFGGSATDAAAALLDPKSAKLAKADLDRLAKLIAEARKEGR